MSAPAFRTPQPPGGQLPGGQPPPPPPTPGPTSTPGATTTGGFRPATPRPPIMGRLEQLPNGDYFAWTGGVPLSDWSGLTPESLNADRSPNQARSFSIGSEQKAHHYRRKGLDPAFKPTDSLDHFQYQVQAHLREYGLDTISYLADPVTPTTMVSTVDMHSKFSIESVIVEYQSVSPRYDQYDKDNDKTAVKFLLDSLDPDFCSIIRSKTEVSDPFVVV